VSLAINPPTAEPGISPEAYYKKIGFKPHSAGQAEYLFSTARFSIPCCGRRYGKSLPAGHRVGLKAFMPDTYNWIVGPTYKLGEKEFRVVWNDYQKLGILKYCRKAYSPHQGDMYIVTPWNSHIEVVSADKPDALLGEALSHACMSEAARHQRATWEQFIEPALSDLRGTADFPSTPQGYNWYHGLYMLGQEFNPGNYTVKQGSITNLNPAGEKIRLYQSWNFPTWENIARFPGGYDDPEIQRVKRVASKQWFDQEYGALFTTQTGAILEEWDDAVHISPHVYDPTLPNYLAFDYGFSNPFVCLDIQIDPAPSGSSVPTAYVWREYYKSNVSTMEHGIYLRDRPNPTDYKVDAMWGDPRGADEAATLALTIGYVGFEDVRWKLAIEQIKRMLKARPAQLYVDPSCVNLIRQMAKLHIKEMGRGTKFDLQEMTGDGNIQHKVDDHAVDALRYFIGPYYVAGAGMHFSDVYGQNYRGSESEDFFTLNSGVTLDELVKL